MKCICCSKPSRFSIQLCQGSQGNLNDTMPRYYIPNQKHRNESKKHSEIKIEEVYFCHDCMRKIEDNLRATILYLKNENQ